MDCNCINEKIKTLKSRGKVFSNYFGILEFSNCEFLTTDKTVLIIKHEYKVDRLYYFTLDISDLLENALVRLSKSDFCLDLITKKPEQFERTFIDAGLILKSRMKRVAVSDVSQVLEGNSAVAEFFDPNIGEFPEKKDAPQIYDLLWEVFDTDISHLPDLTEVENSIDRNEFTWYNKDGKVSLLQMVIKPKSLYINQVYNPNEKNIIHAMLLNRIKEYCANGGKYMYSWVEETNIPSMKFHAKYQMEPDGLWNIVFKAAL